MVELYVLDMHYTTYYFEYEPLFWIALGFVVAFYLMRHVDERYQFLGVVTVSTLFLFGFSGLLESYVSNSPLLSLSLLMLKIWSVTSLLIALLVYFDVRRSEYVHLQNKHVFRRQKEEMASI